MALKDIHHHELVRKAIHLSSAAIPLLYWHYLDRDIMLKGVSLIALGFLCAEYLRFHLDFGSKWFFRIFGAALRKHEHHKLTGATYVFSGAVVSIFLFPKDIAVPSLLVLSVADTMAALVGIPFGRHKFLAKSVEGSLTFFLTAAMILVIFFPGYVIPALLVAVLVTFAEAYPIRLDDNFVIPTVAGILLYLMKLLL